MNFKHNFPYLIYILIICIASACASIGNPSGGPRDEDPPRFVHSNPGANSVSFSGNHIDLWFDEIVNVKDALSKVTLSPPSAQVPRVSSQGKKVSVQFSDTLLPNTTYTIDFGNAIEDNNEQNKLENFLYTFSTGPDLDTLSVAGMVLSAEYLEPMQGKLVGLHSNPDDSAFLKTRFDRVARTDEYGRFIIGGLKPGKYRIYALDDKDADYKYSSPEEEIAFLETFISPSTGFTMVSDTILNFKTGKIDTIVERQRTLFLPNNILLRSFTSAFRQQYLKKYERIDTTRLSFSFNSKSLTPPSFKIVGAPNLKDWFIKESTPDNDSITLWIKPRSLISADTLRVALTYLRSDSANNLSPFNDTLKMTFDRKKHDRILAQAQKDLEQKLKKNPQDSATLLKKPSLEIKFLSNSIINPSQEILFQTATPVEQINPDGIKLMTLKDSVWSVLPFDGISQPDSLQPRNFKVSFPWKYDTQYQLTVDSASFKGIYGLVNDSTSFRFSTGKEGDYSTVRMRITGIPDSISAFAQILNNDSPIRSEKVINGNVVFRYLPAGKYYVRLYLDRNDNGVYDPGDFSKNLQPDLAYYYPKAINLKKNWDKDESWNIFATPVNLQKPEAIRKNRPQSKRYSPETTPDEEEEEED